MSNTITSTALRSQINVRKNQNRVRINQKSELGPVSNIIILGVILAILGLIYLTQISKTNAYSYQVNNLEQRKSQLVEEQENLLVETARLQSIEKLKNSDVAKNLDQPTTVNYSQ